MPREKKHTGLYRGPGAEALRTTIGAAGEVTQVAGAASLNIFGASIGAVRNVLSTLTGGETQPLSDFMTARVTQRIAARDKAAEERNVSVGETNAAKRIAEAPRSPQIDLELQREYKGPKATAAPTAASSATPIQRPDYIGGKRNYYPEPTVTDRQAYDAAPDYVKRMAGSGRIPSYEEMQYSLAPDWVKRTTRGDIPTYAEMQRSLRQTPTEGTGQWQRGALDMPSGGGRTSGSTQPDLPNAPRATYKDVQPEFPGRGEKRTPYQQKVEKLFESTRAQDLINQMRRENLIQEMRVDSLVQDTRIQELLKKTKIQSVVDATKKEKKKKKK